MIELIDKLRLFAAEFMPGHVSECEINPLVVSGDELIALDVLIKPGSGVTSTVVERPLWKIRNLLEPRSVAIIGVSEKLNPGHIIINNLLREGFDRSRIYVVKQGSDLIGGCRCYSDIGSLPERVDLFIASVSAAQTPDVLEEIIERRSAESVIIIAGGLEEKSGSGKLAASMRAMLARARRDEWRGPVINGGNCLGIRSVPGRYDTMFIPETKLPVPQRSVAPVAIISQSGAFAISRMSKLTSVNPRYAITVGNQMDLTVSDYLVYLKDDPDLSVFAVYVEGFKPLDGISFLTAAREITATGRTVIFYLAGRTVAGAKATSSHTASIAGDYRVACALARSAGVIVAESLEEFEDLTKVFALLGDRRVAGLRLAAVSNAGFECVAVADNLGGFELAEFSASTRERIEAIFKRCHIDAVVDSHNPLDLTPMTDDAGYEEAIRAVMDDEMVEAGIIGCVPLTAALNTMSAGPTHGEDLHRESSVAMRMAKLKDETKKPWVVVIDAGAIYDPMSRLLESKCIPVFRTADRAARILNIYCAEQLSRTVRAARSRAAHAI
jgi:acyl-CoA synthetase (NDP forming)